MDVVLAVAGWLILAVISLVAAACAGRVGHEEDLRRGYDDDLQVLAGGGPQSFPPHT